MAGKTYEDFFLKELLLGGISCEGVFNFWD